LDQTDNPQKLTFTDRMRRLFKGILDPIARFFIKIGLRPNNVTTLSLLGNIAGAIFIGFGQVTIGGLVVLLSAPLDALDGTMARMRGEVTRWGAFVDSVSDRYSELILLGGVLVHFLLKQDLLSCFVTYLAACGAVLVSYVKSRAETMDYEAKIGFLSRLERYIVLIPCLVFNIPIIAIWILAIFGNFTALQRIFHVRKQAWNEIKTQQQKGPKS
jgi:CDP-diacylglycerol--glycerol-3-phosphate 3-phosphatidyltransferase